MSRTAIGAVLSLIVVLTTFSNGSVIASQPFGPTPERETIGRTAALQNSLSADRRNRLSAADRAELARFARFAEDRPVRVQVAAVAAPVPVAPPTTTPPTTAAPAPAGGLVDLGIFEVTCYSLQGTTASGRPVGPDVVATDPRVIPLGTYIEIAGIGRRVAADTGGAIKGKILDIWMADRNACIQFGRQHRQVWRVS